MSNIQIRNVPPELHRKLKARAAEVGMSLSDYMLQVARREASHPSREEMLARLRALPPIEIGDLAVRSVHEGRAENDRELP